MRTLFCRVRSADRSKWITNWGYFLEYLFSLKAECKSLPTWRSCSCMYLLIFARDVCNIIINLKRFHSLCSMNDYNRNFRVSNNSKETNEFHFSFFHFLSLLSFSFRCTHVPVLWALIYLLALVTILIGFRFFSYGIRFGFRRLRFISIRPHQVGIPFTVIIENKLFGGFKQKLQL